MLEPERSFDVEEIVDRARSLWRAASGLAPSVRIELFAKVSLRSKATSDLARSGVTFSRALESGLALRLLDDAQDRAGFAAASGLTADVVRWTVDTASKFNAQAPASAPGPSDSVADARWDIDRTEAVPCEDALTTALTKRPNLDWVEAGATVEVLVGAEGWIAVRKRHRVWARGAGPDARLVAQRGFADWEKLLDLSTDDASFLSPEGDADLGVLVFTPEASASVVSALVDAFHGASAQSRATGRGWDVIDEPAHPKGLSGGTFDDAGFPTESRVLAAGGLWLGRLGGRGTFRRASFRDLPTEMPTNLVVAGGETGSVPHNAAVARRCRVLKLSEELWVLELDLSERPNPKGRKRRWVRVHPSTLLRACASRFGQPGVTPAGPIVPWLQFEGLTLGEQALAP
jgi:hypothetical protein